MWNAWHAYYSGQRTEAPHPPAATNRKARVTATAEFVIILAQMFDTETVYK